MKPPHFRHRAWRRVDAHLDARRDPLADAELWSALSAPERARLTRLCAGLSRLEHTAGTPRAAPASRPRRRSRARLAAAAGLALCAALALWRSSAEPQPRAAAPTAPIGLISTAPAVSRILDYRVELIVDRAGQRSVRVLQPGQFLVRERRAASEPVALATLSVLRPQRVLP